MELSEPNRVIAFDTLFSTNHIAMLKILLPYTDARTQKSLAVYIKYLELHYALSCFREPSVPFPDLAEGRSAPDMKQLCRELLPYCTESEKKQIEQILHIFQSMEMYQEMSRAMDMMKDIMPDMGSFSDLFGSTPSSEKENGGPDIMNLLMNMMTPEQKEMFALFGGDTDDK